MVDQSNEWLPLITPGAAVDGVEETGGGRGREMEEEEEGFATVWLLPALSITTKEQSRQRWLSPSYFHTFLYWVRDCSFQSTYSPSVQLPKQTVMLHTGQKRLSKQKAIVKTPFSISNVAVKISCIANTHSTGLCWPHGWRSNDTGRWLWKEGATGSAGDW